MSAGDRQVEKIMSMTLADFHRGLKVLDPGLALGPGAKSVRVELAGACADIDFEAIDSKVYGTLLEIPRARVSLDFGGSPPEARRAFLEKFDFTFRRGGG